MAAYETILVFSTKASEEAMATALEKFKDVIAKGGTVDKVDEWGKRRLAYEINYETEGHYVLIDHNSDPASITELTRNLRISDVLLRYLIVRKDEK